MVIYLIVTHCGNETKIDEFRFKAGLDMMGVVGGHFSHPPERRVSPPPLSLSEWEIKNDLLIHSVKNR